MGQATFAEVMAARNAKLKALNDAQAMVVLDAEFKYERLRVYPALHTRELVIDTQFNQVTLSEEYCFALIEMLGKLFPERRSVALEAGYSG